MPTASRPTVFVVSETPLESPDLEVVATDPASLLATVRASGAPRWLLLGSGDGLEVVRRFAGAVLSGQAPVFGLAGAVLVGASEEITGLPTLLLERTDGAAVRTFWLERAGLGPRVPADFAAMIGSARVSARTRGIHARRALADDPAYAPVALDATQFATLRALADRVVPQDGPALDLAARVDAQLARGEGDGWRHADLPADVETYRAALDELRELGDLPAAGQDTVLQAVTEGAHATTGRLSGAQLALWFEDACNDLVRQWVAHPATMARIGYDGLANGGDDAFPGFVELGAGARESWEPEMAGVTR